MGSGVELTGTRRVNQRGKGRPSSRAKDQAWREAAAVELMHIESVIRTIGTVMPMAAAVLPVAVAKTSTKGYGAEDMMICSSTDWMAKQKVTIMMKPRAPLRKTVAII